MSHGYEIVARIPDFYAPGDDKLILQKWLIQNQRMLSVMSNLLQSFTLTFVPLFIVIDALGNLPFVISLSEGMSKQEHRKMIHVATVTAMVVGLVFLFLGQLILRILDISVDSFAIAGGLILLVLSIKYTLDSKFKIY